MTELILSLVALFLCFACGIVVRLLARARRGAQALTDENVRLAAALESQREMAELRERMVAQRYRDLEAAQAKVLAEKEKVFAESLTTLKEQFVNLAAAQMKAQGEGLAQLNKTNLDALLTPVRDQVQTLQKLTEQSHRESRLLGETMTKDVGAIGRIAQGLQGIASALTSNTRYQGRSGEDVLAEKLRQAGLEENVNFVLQRGTGSERPDAQVWDPENRWLIIDSKVSLTAYIDYMEAEDEGLRAEKLRLHVASVRQKIDQLAKKKYPQVFAAEHPDRNYLPVTAMFVPYEAPLMEALKAEPSLWQSAAEHNVILVTPLTLLAYLRLVFLAWQHEKEARNQQEIVETARELLARMNGFLETFESVGTALGKLAETYEKAKGVLVDAPRAQTIAKSARRLIDLNVRLEGRKGRKLERAACLKDIDETDTQTEGENHADD